VNARDSAQDIGSGTGEFRRMAAIAKIAVEKGWAHYVERLGWARTQRPGAEDAVGSEASRLRETLEALGPIFVKFGQMLSQRPDIFPEDLVRELRSLQDRATSFPAAIARQIIEQELDRAPSELFTDFDDQPIAAASMAQVHRATWSDGTAVIVKVQRPGIAETVEDDIAVLRRLARIVPKVIPTLRVFNLTELVEEFAVTLRAELDFVQEGRNAERFAALNRDEPSVSVPSVFWDATARRVLTMEHSAGCRLDAASGNGGRAETVQTLMRLFLTQVFEHGVFHADPHPGNVFLLPDGRICFHDFGALGELSPTVQESLRQIFLAVMARDPAWVASAYLGMGGAIGQLDRAAFTNDLSASLDRYYRQSGLGAQSFSAIIQEFVRLGRKHQIRLVRETTMLLRAFAELESLLKSLDSRFNSLNAFQTYSTQLLRHAFLPELGMSNVARVYRVTSAAREMLLDTPIALRRLIGRLERGDPLFEIRHQSGGSLEQHLLHASNRLAFALVIASMVIGSSLLLTAHSGPHWAGLPILGLAGFTVAAVLGIAWALLAIRSGRL